MSASIAVVPRASDWRRPARLGYLVIFLTFGIGGLWATFAKVGGAVVAPAYVAVETNRKTVQHLEGGIVSEILVKENDYVSQGQVVVRLSDIQAKASLATVRNQLVAAEVQEARLTAERDQKPEIELPGDIRDRMGDPIVAHSVADQQAAFADRRRSLQGQISVLESRIEGLKTEIQGLAIEQRATQQEVVLIDQELVGYHQLLTQHLMQLSQVLDKERERTRLEGVIGRSIADQAKAQNTIGETNLDIASLKHRFQEETASGILDVRQKISDLTEKMAVTTDILHRIDVRAPVSGHVQDLKVYSAGQVVRAGDPLMQIVPDDERLVVHAQFSPTDIDRLQRASHVEVRFPSFHARTTPVILGEIASISADRMTDEATHQPYYLGLVSVNKLQIPEELRDRIRAGMPAEVIAPLGDRSVLSYLVSPLREAWHRSLREE
jgi:HlyD family secretion protein